MQFWNEQTLSFNLVYSSICYPAGMGTSKIRLLFATLLQHYQVHDKLHEKLFISTCSFLWINESGWEFVLKKLVVKNSFIEKTYVVGTHWNCLKEAIPMCTYNICYWKQGRKLFGNLHFPSIMSIVFASFKHPKLPIIIKNSCHSTAIVDICMTAISRNSSSWTALFAYLLVGWL